MDCGYKECTLSINPDEIKQTFREVQDHICQFVQEMDGKAYREDNWGFAHGEGGGRSRLWENANLLEKGGVNFSAIIGDSLPPSAATQFKIPPGTPYLATGVSLVLHPRSPLIPTIHMNIRYFQAGDIWWFGGGVDVTPYYPEEKEVIYYHKQLQALCGEHGKDYAQLKEECDKYFYLKHRDEARGVGGLFFDHVHTDKAKDLAFVKGLGMAFPALYKSFIENHREQTFTEAQRNFQLYRRGRYVEFNLIYDRGTLFGLQSNGRTESILMSLPAVAHWVYDYKPEAGSAEARLTEFFLKPQDWINRNIIS